MSYLLEILGRGLLAELGAAFRNLLRDDGHYSTQELENFVLAEPDNAAHHQSLGIRLLSDHQNAQAKAAFGRALVIDPSDRVSRCGLACAMDELGMTRQAAETLAISVNDHPGDAATWFALGFCREKLGETEAAIHAYEETLALNLQLRNAHERLAAIYLTLDDVETAIRHYKHVCWCEPDDLTAGLTLANLFLRAHRYEDAIKQYESVITLEPDNWEMRDELIAGLIDASRYEDALEILGALIAQRPECADQYLQLGDIYAKMGRQKEALDAFAQALTLNPDYLEAAIKVGATRLHTGDYAGAAQAFNRAIETNDRILGAYLGLGVAQQALGQFDDAQASLAVAAEVEPNGTLLFSELARLQLKVAAGAQRKRYIEPRSIAASPQGPPGEVVSTLLQRQIANLHTAIAAHPNHADLHYRLGLLLRQNGDTEGAIGAFQSAVAINPSYFKALTKLAVALHHLGRVEDAIATLHRALDIDAESVELHYQLGLMFADRNEFALALDRFEYAATREPEKLDYVANVALALQNMGLIDRAEGTWRTLCEIARETSDV